MKKTHYNLPTLKNISLSGNNFKNNDLENFHLA